MITHSIYLHLMKDRNIILHYASNSGAITISDSNYPFRTHSIGPESVRLHNDLFIERQRIMMHLRVLHRNISLNLDYFFQTTKLDLRDAHFVT